MHSPHANRSTPESELAAAGKPLTIIAGCTAFGAELAQQMSLAGFSILVIDSRREALMRMGTSFDGILFEGDATNPQILKKCAIDRAGHLLALFDDDAMNLLIGKIAETMFRVPDVRVQLADGANRAALVGTSIQAICPAEILTAKIIGDLARTMEVTS